jgi:hypothetical protein
MLVCSGLWYADYHSLNVYITKVNTSCFRVILSTAKHEAWNAEENQTIDDVYDALKKGMEKFITEKSPKSRAQTWSKPHRQSQKSLALDTVFNNLVTGTQQLPARPRDFRLNLAEEEINIDYGELSDELAKLVRLYIMDRHTDKIPMHRGRPNHSFSPERRGRFSYYEFSELKMQINNLLREPSTMKAIDDRLLRDNILYRFLKYSISCAFYQAKDNEQALLNSFRPYGLKRQQLELNAKKGWSLVVFNEMSEEHLNQLATAYAINALQRLKISKIPLVYEIVVILQAIGNWL